MNIELKLVGELNDAAMIAVINVLSGSKTESAQPAKKAAAAPAAKVDQEEKTEAEPAAQPAKAAAKPATAAKAAAPAKAAKPAAKAAVMSDEDKLAALEAMDAEEQLATVQAEVTKHSKKGKTADIKKLLAIFDSPKVSELDPATYGEFYGLVLQYVANGADADAADAIVESYAI